MVPWKGDLLVPADAPSGFMLQEPSEGGHWGTMLILTLLPALNGDVRGQIPLLCWDSGWVQPASCSTHS